MAKISTYPSADTPLLLSDRLIGTEAIREMPSPIPLATKNFSLGELLTLFSSNFPAPSLQEVLDTGNTATQDIYITGVIESDVIKPVNIEDTTGSQGTTFQYLSKGVSSISWVDLPVDGLQDVLNKQNTATQNITLTGNISSTYITPRNIKDELLNIGSVGQVLTKTSSGVMWKNSSVPTAPSLADVLSTGNSATNDINLTGDMYATSFVKSGGLSSQFLKADGSVDSSAYALASSVPTATSDLTNDGEDGVNPFITAADIPTIPTATSDLINDGEDGINPFITLADVPVPTNGLPAGGTAGQILTKVDSVDYNATWQENFADWTSVVKHTVKNNGLSGTITKGTAVYVTGSNGTNMLVGRASNTSEATSSKTMGLMQSDITTTGSTQTGFVITEGLLDGLNTAGQTAGDPVWLGVNGALIYGLANKPYAPAHLVFIGIVTKVSAGNGEIFVKVQNGFELKEIHDVDIISTTPINGDVLGYNGTLWVNKTIAGWLGFTPVTNARTITINGTTQDLSADRTFTIATGLTVGTTPITSGTVGRVLFEGTGNVLQESANLFWDNTNVRLGIGTAAPISELSVSSISGITLQSGAIMPNLHRDNTDGAFLIRSYSTGTSTFTTNVKVRSNGNFLIGTTTDAGFKLDVNGTARVSGTTTITPATLTGSDATSALDISQTWNTTGTPIALKVNITDTASASLSDLINLQVGGVSKFRVVKTGFFSCVAGGDILGNLCVGGSSINASSQLEVRSTTKGFLPPRMTTTQKNAIASPAAGLWVYDNTLNASNYYNGTTWVDRGSNIEAGKKVLSFFTDFLSNNALDGLQTFASGGTSGTVGGTLIPNRTNQQGVVFMQTSALATNYIFYSSGTVQLWLGGGAWNYETSININNLSTATDRYRLIFGFGSGTTNATETDGVFLTYDEGGTANGTAASANWQCVTVSSSVRTLTTTTTAVTAATWNKLRIEVNAAGTSVAFYVNGTLIATHTTNIPVPNRYILIKQGIAKTIGVTSLGFYCDYIGYENTLTTAR